jgi:hypothetical protein
MKTRIHSIKADSTGFSGTIYSTRVPAMIEQAMAALDVGELEVYGEYDYSENKNEGWARIVSARVYDAQNNLLFDLVDFSDFDLYTLEQITAEAQAVA